MDTARARLLTEEQEAGRKIAIRRMLVTVTIGAALLWTGLLLWGVHKGARLPHLSVPVGLMLVAGYAVPLYGLYQFNRTLSALGIRPTRRRG